MGDKLKRSIQELEIYEKIAFVVMLICSISVTVTGIMVILNIWSQAIVICENMLAVLLLSLAALQWKKNRNYAKFTICTSFFILLTDLLYIIT